MRLPRILIWAVLAAATAPAAAFAAPGDPHVVYTANSYVDGAVILRADPAAGSLVEVSRNGTQGTLFQRPFDLAVEPGGHLVVADLGEECIASTPKPCASDGKIIRVDPLSGRQSLLSGGGLLVDPAGIAVAPGGLLYVAENKDSDGEGRVVRIDPPSGAQTLVTEDNRLDLPFGIVVERDGNLLVSNRVTPAASCAAGGPGALVRVNPATGAQTAVAANLLNHPLGLTLDAGGVPAFANECGPNGLVALPNRLITPNGPADVLETPERIAVDPAGNFLVSDFAAADGDGGIVGVNAATGSQRLLAHGELFNHPMGIAAVVNRPPAAVLRLSRATVAAGAPVGLDGSTSSDPEGLRLHHEWDLNGDGVFEAVTGAIATGTREWSSNGTVTVRLRVTDPHGAFSVTEAALAVDGSTPVITDVRATARVVAVAGPPRRGASASRAGGPPSETQLRFRLSEPARVRVGVERRSGRPARRGARCRVGPRRGRRCIRWSEVRVISQPSRAGGNRLRVVARGLRPGRYRLALTAIDGVGHRAAERRLPLRVVRR